MDVIFMPKRLIWKRLQCVHILSLITHCHTLNLHCDAVLAIHVSIFLTKKHIISLQKKHPQYGFTFVQEAYVEGTSSGVVDLRRHMDISGSEYGTETYTHSKPTQTQEGDKVISRSTEGVQ